MFGIDQPYEAASNLSIIVLHINNTASCEEKTCGLESAHIRNQLQKGIMSLGENSSL